jgi:hypothetical protein
MPSFAFMLGSDMFRKKKRTFERITALVAFMLFVMKSSLMLLRFVI